MNGYIKHGDWVVLYVQTRKAFLLYQVTHLMIGKAGVHAGKCRFLTVIVSTGLRPIKC